MKTFEEICSMSQVELKKYLGQYLRSKGYKVINEDGFLYAKAKEENPVRVLLVAHMDTVHKERITEVEKVPYLEKDNKITTRLSSPQGIGGDDRCGIYMIMNIIKEHNVSILFAEDEEVGCVGSTKFTKTQYCKDLESEIDYMIELDRQGSNDAVFYSCDNPEFTKWIEKETGYEKAWGTYTDISKIMPVAKIAGVNFSCGYYNAHTTREYVVLEEMEATQKMVCNLLSKEIPQQFEYIEKKTFSSSYFGGYSGYRQMSYFSDYDDYDEYYSCKNVNTKKSNKKTITKINDEYVFLTVEVDEDLYGVSELSTKGKTKPECWMNLFMEYDDLCFGYILDYYYE